MADRSSIDVEALNDRLALEHPSDEYYERSPWPVRFVERRRLPARFDNDITAHPAGRLSNPLSRALNHRINREIGSQSQ